MVSIFNWAIDKYLSKYLEINKDETKASLFTGDIEMSNVKIKPEIFTTMNIPYFQLVNGYIGKIKLKVQFPRFYLYPIKMVIEKVFFHAKQKKLDTIDKKVEIENMETYKNDQLLSMEELTNEVKNLQNEGGPGYLDRIINNLEIEIKDICVRFDDDLSYNLIPFTFGLLLKNLKIKTVDENFKEPEEGKTIPIGDINRKILKMENFSLYLDTYENQKKLVEFNKKIVENEATEVKDEKLKTFLGPMLEYYRYCLSETQIHINERNSHQYLNYNSGFLIKFAMNPKLKNNEPQYLADCKFDKILMSMSLVQIKAAMKLLAYQDLNSKYQIGLAKEYYNKVLNENDKISYIENYIEYYKAKYGAKKNEKEAKKYEEKIKQVEKGLKYEDIWIMREAAEYKLFHNSEIDKIDQQIKKLEGGSGFFSFFSSGPNEEQKKEIEKLKEQKKKLMKEDVNENVKEKLKLSTSSSSGEIDKLKDIPDDYVLYKISLELPMFSLDINKSIKEKMLSMEFDNLSINGKMKKKGQLFNLSIDDISAKQYQLKNNNMYETILATIEQKDDKPKNKEDIKNGGTCDIEFENNPNLEKSNFRFKFRNTKRLIITVNLYSIQYIMNKVLDSLATTISKFGSERYIGSGEIQTLIKSGFESNYISGGFQHFNIDLDIEMKSPIILYPQDILDPYNKKCLFIKCGDFEMKSDLPPRQILEKNYEVSNDRKELFDIYKMKIENFCMFTYDKFEGDFNNLVNIKGLNLVENITVNFQFEQNFESKNKNFEKTKILLDLGKIKFNLRDTQIIFFIDLLAKMQLCNKQVAIEVEKKTSLYEIEEDKQNKEDLAKEEKEKEEKQKEKKEKEEKKLKEKEEKLLKEKEEKNKKKEELLNRLAQNEDPNSLLFEFKMESIELSLMKSISLNERKILSELDRNILENIDIEYRDFIVLSLNNFLINVITTEKGNMSVDISMESTGIKDMETIIISKDNPKGEILINEEFQDLIKMNFHEKKERRKQHLNRYMKKSSKIFKIYIVHEDEKREENKNEKFMKISYKSNNIAKTQEVNIVLEKIRICFSMSSMARLYQFYSYYFNMYSKSIDDVTYILAEMEEKSKKELYKKNLLEERRLSKEILLEKELIELSIQSSKSSEQRNKDQEIIDKIFEERKEKKKIFGDKFVQHLAQDLKVFGNGFQEKIINTSNQKVEEEVEEEIKIKEKEETKKIREKSKMKITFQMKKASLDFPLEDTKSKTKVLKFNFNFLCTILMNNEYDNIQNMYGRQVGIEYITKNMNLSAKCVNVKFKISQFKDKAYSTKDCDYMLQGFRFNSNINSFLLLPHREKSVMAINVFFEPLIFNIGFRQTKTLMGFMPKLTQFLTDMNKEYDDPLKELNVIEEPKNEIIIEDENNIINDNNDNIIIEQNEENLTEEEKKERDRKKKKIIEGYKIRKRQELEAKKLKKQKERENQKKLKIKTNIDEINNMIDVKVTFEKLSFKYFDDSGAYLIPLLKIESHDILTHFIQNSNPDSVENISNLILESISRREIPLKDYDINGLYMYVQFDFNTSINFYNDRINNWEPIIERYSGILKVDQVTSFSRMRVSFNSDDIFNINVSISSMNVLNRVLKKFGESEEKWDKELNNIDDVSSNTNSRKAIEFVNLSGIEIRCWLDAKKEALLKDNKNDKNIKYQFSLASNKENNKKIISSNELKSYYSELSEAQLRINKDKFSFQIRGYVPVYSNDFSTNYTSNFRMKKDKIAKDEIRYIYTGIKNKRNQANAKKDPNAQNDNEIIIRSNSLALSDLLREDEQQDLISESNDNDGNYSESNTDDINEGMKEKLIEKDIIPKQQINLFEDEVEILVKVRQSGTTKTIIFQSNVFIFNNLQIPIKLLFISPDDYLNKYGGKDSNINHLENDNNTILLNSCQKYSIPIYYITNKYRVYVSFHNRINPQENNFVLLYENFSILKRNLPEFIKYNNENSPEFEGDKRTILEDQYSKILKIERNKDTFYISCNLLVQKGGSDKINEMPNILEEANKYINADQNNKELRTKNIDLLIDSIKHDFYGKTFSYLFILDESLMIENKMPFNIQCKMNEKNMTIRPLQQKEFLDIDQSKTSLQFYFNYDNKKFISDILNINELDKKNIDKNKEYIDETSQIKLYNEEKKDEFIECNISFQDNFNASNLIGAYEKEYEQSLRSFQNKKRIIIYSKCIFVNKTDNLLYLLSEDEKNLEKEPINKFDNYSYKILPNSISLINAKDIKNKFKLKTEGSDWSKKFNINTVGNTGVISLDIPDKNNKDKITMLDVGISIPTSWYFTESLLITIVPRFSFINKLGLDIVYNQYNNKINKEKNDKNELFEKKELKNNESVNLNLLKANKNMKKMIRIKFENSKEFSTPFDLEEMGDIDLKIEIDKDMKKEIEKRNEKIDKEIKKLKKLEKIKMKEMKKEEKEELIENIDNDNISDEEEKEEEIILIKKDKEQKEKKIEIKQKEKEKEKELTPEEYIKKELEEEKELLEKYKLRPRKYIIFQQNQKDYLLVRISKSTINGLINIIIFPPEYPQYEISNESNHRLTFKQKKDEYSNELFYLERNASIPYVWGDSLRNEKILIIKSDKNEMEINLNDIKILNKKFEINENGINKSYMFYFQTLIENNKTRKLIIKNETKENKNSGYFLEVLKGKKKSINLKFKIVTKGLGISVIDNEPKEIFYISAYGSTIEGNKFSYKKDDCEHSIINVMFTLRNFQIDYCLEDNFKSMFIPVKQITPQIDEENNNAKNKEELIPLIQSIVSFHTITNPLTLISSDEIPQIDLTIQPFKLNFSQFQIISLMSLYQEIKPELDFFLTKPEPFEEYNNIDELIQSLFGEAQNERNELIYPPQYYDKMLNLSLGSNPQQLIYESENHRMFFAKNIHIGSLEIGVTTRIDLSAFKDMLPSFLLGIISALGNVFLHITDYKLKFTTSLYSDVFADVYSLSDTLYNTYYEQLLRGLFRIVGNLDIIGNPTGYVSSIADGFMQIIEAPRKGLINGPLGFGEGIAKGFGTFITTVLSSTFDVVGKISGTLLASCEVLQGEKVFEQLEEREPEHIFEGLYIGLKEGVIDLGKGLGGIFYKPYMGAKKEGVKGFFKGLGSGFLGAVVSPFTAIFRVTNNIFVGLKNTVNLLNPKLKTERFRYPRTIEKVSGLKSYDEDKATIQAMLDYLKDYQGEEILYFKQFKYLEPIYENSKSYLILTNKCILVVYQAEEVVFQVMVNYIENIEVHKEQNGNNYDIVFNLKDNSRKYIRTKDAKLCTDFYLMFENSKE